MAVERYRKAGSLALYRCSDGCHHDRIGWVDTISKSGLSMIDCVLKVNTP